MTLRAAGSVPPTVFPVRVADRQAVAVLRGGVPVGLRPEEVSLDDVAARAGDVDAGVGVGGEEAEEAANRQAADGAAPAGDVEAIEAAVEAPWALQLDLDDGVVADRECVHIRTGLAVAVDDRRPRDGRQRCRRLDDERAIARDVEVDRVGPGAVRTVGSEDRLPQRAGAVVVCVRDDQRLRRDVDRDCRDVRLRRARNYGR